MTENTSVVIIGVLNVNVDVGEREIRLLSYVKTDCRQAYSNVFESIEHVYVANTWPQSVNTGAECEL